MPTTRILLVAPDAGFRELLRDCLTAALIDVAFGEATEAEEALQAVRGGAWDLVLLDLRLPRTNGLVTLRWLKQISPSVPVVVVTGLPSEPYAGAAMRAGAAGFITSRGFLSRERARERVGGMVRALVAEQAHPGVQG